MRFAVISLALLNCLAFPLASASAQHNEETGHPMPMDAASENSFDRDSALKISQGAVGRKAGNHSFTTVTGETVTLSEYEGRPVAINLIYTSCPHTCPLIVQSLAETVNVARNAVGANKLTVLTIGFDVENDTPQRMKQYRRTQGINHRDWHFLSADEATIKALSKDLGFLYKKTPYGFDHLAQVTLLDSNGIVAAQVYGENVPVPQFVEPLKRLVFGRGANANSFTGLVNQVRLFCTVYNPNTGEYRFDYSLILSLVIGLACLTLVGTVLVRGFMR